MASYDAEIRVRTSLDNSNFDKGAEGIQHSLEEIEKGVDTAKEKLKALDELGLPKSSQIYQSAAADLKKWNAELENAKKKQVETTTEFSVHLNMMRVDVEEYAATLKQLEKEGQYFGDADYDRVYLAWKDAVDAVKKYQAELNKQTEKEKEVASEAQRLAQIKANATVSDQKMITLLERRKQLQQEIKELEQAGVTAGYREYDARSAELEKINQKINASKKSIKDLATQTGKIGNAVKGMLGKIQAPAQKVFRMLTSGANRSAKSMNRMRMSFVRMLAMSVAFSAVFRAISAVSEGLGQGFAALMKHSDSLASSVQSLKNSLSTLGNSFAAAFAPIVQAAIPYLVQLINWVTRAINAIGQLFAYLTGKSTWTKATEVQAGYNDELNGTAAAAKKAYGALAKFDDLDVLQKQDSSKGSGGGAGAEVGGFEEVPISEDIKKFGDKLKDFFSKFFAPLKEAWNRQGKEVMDAWKYALEEIKLLAKDIGRDFLEMWNQEATIKMFEDILIIVKDIGLIIGNLAHNFREAWNENKTGLHILENIRDIFAVIIHNIRLAADATVEWSKHLDFSPLLTAFERFTAALVPAFDALSGILTDFYTQVLLPLSKWALEEGLPKLLDVLTGFVEKVDWEGLRENFSNLWDSLEPFAETVGEGLIIFIERVSDLVANFLNSDALEGFLDHLADWMDSVTPEDVADGIQKLATAFIALKAALAVLDGVIAGSKLIVFVSNLKTLFGGLKKIATLISGLNLGAILSGVTQALSVMNPGMIGEIGIKLESMLEGTIFDPRAWEGIPGKVYAAIDKAVLSIINFLLNAIESAFVSISNVLAGTFNWDETFAIFSEAKEHIEKAFDGEEVGKNIVLGVGKGIVAALGFLIEPINDFVMTLVDTVCSLLGIHSPSTVFQEIGVYLVEGLLLGIQETWLLLQEWFAVTFENLVLFFAERWTSIQETTSEIWTAISEFLTTGWTYIKELAAQIWTYIKDFLFEKWTEVKENTSQIWTALKKFLSDTWENIKKTVTEIFEEVRKKLEEIWQKIKEAIQEKIDLVMEKIDELIGKATKLKDDASEAFNNLKENVINALSPIIEKIKEFIDWVQDAIQAVQNFFSSGYDQVGSSAAKTSKASAARSSAISLHSVSAPVVADAQSIIRSIPHLASGAVIRGGSPFLAVLGDQQAGQTNIEAPLSTIRQAVREELSGLNFGGGQLKVVLQVNGADLAQATLQDFLSEMNRQGYDVEVLGV